MLFMLTKSERPKHGVQSSHSQAILQIFTIIIKIITNIQLFTMAIEV
jgi:hypothetical protein